MSDRRARAYSETKFRDAVCRILGLPTSASHGKIIALLADRELERLTLARECRVLLEERNTLVGREQ